MATHDVDKTPLEESWFWERERAVAWMRLIFAILAIAVIQLNPARTSRFPLLSNIALGSFPFYSMAALYFTLKRTVAATQLAAIIATALDIVWICIIVLSTGGSRTPFFFYYSFPVISASLRWGLKGSLPVAFVGVAVYAAIRLSLAAESDRYPIGIDTLVVRSLYLVCLGGVFGFLSEFEKRQNQKLLALSKTAADIATLQERRRISFELHDSILQSLATLILKLERTRRELPASRQEAIVQELQSSEELTRSTMKEIRAFLAGKTEQSIAPGTLVDRLHDELRFFQEGVGMEIILECEPEEIILPVEMEREIYYVLREALTNVTRHANAARTEIRLRRLADRVEGSISDNGAGFEYKQESAQAGVGLTAMKERIKNIGGELVIKSSPGHGTKISFWAAVNN